MIIGADLSRAAIVGLLSANSCKVIPPPLNLARGTHLIVRNLPQFQEGPVHARSERLLTTLLTHFASKAYWCNSVNVNTEVTYNRVIFLLYYPSSASNTVGKSTHCIRNPILALLSLSIGKSRVSTIITS